MKPRLDLQKTIQKQRLTYKKNYTFFSHWLLNNGRWIILLFLPILLAFNPKNYIGILGIVVVALWIVFISMGMYFTNSLVLIRGSNLEDNRTQIIELIRHKFPKLIINETGKNIIYCRKETGFTTWGKQITIILNDTDLLVNLTTTGRFEIKSPFHSLSNYIKMKRLSKNLTDQWS